MTAPMPPRSLAATLLLAASLGACHHAPVDSSLRAELVRLGAEDQAAREGAIAAPTPSRAAFERRMLAGDSARTERLRAIVRERGWPGRSVAGDDGAHAAWLLLQHSTSPDLQRSLLPTLWAAARRGDVPTADVALLDDRVHVFDGQAQRYGSQFFTRDGRMVAAPVEDLARLDARRAAVGLPPMAEYVRQLAELYGTPVTWPPTP